VPGGVRFLPDLVVVSDRVEVAVPEPGAREAGENEHAAPLGNSPQLSPTAFGKVPPKPDTETL
jgi:hypothetical protein